jgi:hypothetical protein
VQIDDDQPLQPMAPGHGLLVMVTHTAHEERADGAGTEASGIDRHLGAAARPGQRHAMDDFVQGSGDGGFVQPPQETVESREVRNKAKPESTAQFEVFCQSYFGFPVGPVLVAHEAQDGQQLGLRELVFAEGRAITRHGGGGHVQGHLPARIAPNPLRAWSVAGLAGADRSIARFRRCPYEVELRISTEPSCLINQFSLSANS